MRAVYTPTYRFQFHLFAVPAPNPRARCHEVTDVVRRTIAKHRPLVIPAVIEV